MGRLLDDPPTEEELFDPSCATPSRRGGRGRGRPRPRAPRCSTRASSAPHLVPAAGLAGRPARRLQVIDGWGGDAYVVYRQDDRVCAAMAVVGDSELSTAAFANALTGR